MNESISKKNICFCNRDLRLSSYKIAPLGNTWYFFEFAIALRLPILWPHEHKVDRFFQLSLFGKNSKLQIDLRLNEHSRQLPQQQFSSKTGQCTYKYCDAIVPIFCSLHFYATKMRVINERKGEATLLKIWHFGGPGVSAAYSPTSFFFYASKTHLKGLVVNELLGQVYVCAENILSWSSILLQLLSSPFI